MKRILALIVMACLLVGCAPAANNDAVQQPTVQEEVTVPQETEPQKRVLALDQEEITFQDPGETYQLNSGEIEAAEILWSSENEAVAAVKDGVVTAVERGETVITAEFEDQSVSCRVICDLPVPMVLNENAGERDPMYLPPDVEIVDDSFFDDAVFVGDSQGQAFYNCVSFYGVMKGASHLCRNSYSIESAADDKMLLSWRGQSYVIEDAIEKTGANRVFIMLGINDVGHYRIDQMDYLMGKWEVVIDRIQAKTPHVEICIQSQIPVWTGGETKKVNNEKVRAYNQALEQLAAEKGCLYIDLAPYFVDSTGGLADPYTNDKFVHANAAGVDTWVKVLKAYTKYGD